MVQTHKIPREEGIAGEDTDTGRSRSGHVECQEGRLPRVRGRGHRHPRNLFLIAMYVLLGLQAGRPEAQTLLGSAFDLAGSASDLVGSLSTALMIPVALALSAWLPDRRSVWIIHVVGVSAMAALTAGGPLLVLGVLAFEVEIPIAMAAVIILCVWLLLVNRWLRLSDARSGWHGSERSWERGRWPDTWSLGWVSYCPGCRGRSWWCSASASLLGCPPTSASRSGSCS